MLGVYQTNLNSFIFIIYYSIVNRKNVFGANTPVTETGNFFKILKLFFLSFFQLFKWFGF